MSPQTTPHASQIRLLPPNDVLDCLDAPACAPLLSVLDSAQIAALPPSDQLAEVALRTAIAMTNPQTRMPSPPAICLDLQRSGDTVRMAPSGAVAAILTSRYTDVHESRECEVVSPRTVDWHLQIRAQKRSAWSVVAELPTLTSDSTATGATEYYVAALWAAGWTCTYGRRSGIWRPVRCVMKWIS